MRNVRCKISKHSDTGIIGAIPNVHKNWAESSDAYFPTTMLGHDLISHRNKEDGSLEHELVALGCEIWLSDCFCRYNSFRSAEDVFATDLTNSIRDAFFNIWQYSFEPLKNSPKYPNIEELETVEDFFDGATEEIKKTLELEFSNEDMENEGEEIPVSTHWFEENKVKILDWLKFGYYYSSQKRYRKHDAYSVWRTRQQINDLSKQIQRLELGDEFTVSYDFDGNVKMTEHLPVWR